jgi:cyclic dehypoxanthinyl futalosine synthase
MTEEVVSATGLEYGVTEDQVVNMIREAGYVPAQRTTQYDTIRVYGDEEEPVGA